MDLPESCDKTLIQGTLSNNEVHIDGLGHGCGISSELAMETVA